MTPSPLHTTTLPSPKLSPASHSTHANIPACPDPNLVAALSGSNASADRALALRTRRAIYNALVDRRANREQGRRHLFIALLLTGGLTLALAPALWAGIDDMLAGETLFDLPGMLAALGMTLFAAVAAVLFLLSDDRPPAGRTRPPTYPFVR